MEQAQLKFGADGEEKRRVFTAEWRSSSIEQRSGLVLLKPIRSLVIPDFTQGMEVPDTPRTLRYCISSDRLDRYGDHVFQAGMDTTDYHNVVLWGHNMGFEQKPPIARSVKLWTETRGDCSYTFSDATFAGLDENYELAETCYRLGKAGFIPDASIGMNPKQDGYKLQADSTGKPLPNGGYDFSAWDLLEWSQVPIGANMDAQQVRALKAFLKSGGVNVQPLREWVEQTLDCIAGDDPYAVVSKAKLERVIKLCGFSRGLALLDLSLTELDQAVPAKILAFQAKGSGSSTPEEEPGDGTATHISHKPGTMHPTGKEWDADKERKRATIEQLKSMSLGYACDGTKRAQYFGLHHTADPGSPSCMAALEECSRALAAGEYGSFGVDEAGEEKIREHLRKEYAQYGRTPSWEGAAGASVVKGICAYHKSPVTDGHWDEAAATEGGDPEQWKKQFCGWTGDGTSRSDYYLGHHNKDGSVPKAAIRDALARLNQVKGISEQQRSAAEAHLKHHGRDGGMEFDGDKAAQPMNELSADELVELAFGRSNSDFTFSDLLSELAAAG